MDFLKHAGQAGLRWFTRHVPIRGRHRLADTVGRWVSDPVTVRSINGIKVELDRDIQYHRMMLFDLYEENVLNYLRRRLKPGMVVFDPGCNIGYFAAQVLGMVQPGGQVWSFEPSPTCLTRIRRHNPSGSVPGWNLQAAALTNRSGKLTFFDTPRVVTHGYAVLEEACKPNDRVPVEVAVTSVDDFCAAQGISHIDFLKLDIEDSELPALQGAARMLAERAIDTILVETEVRPDRVKLNDRIFKLLRDSGFRPHHARRDGTLVQVEPERMPPHKEDIIWELQR
jgi:FkbM family methyltransferase